MFRADPSSIKKIPNEIAAVGQNILIILHRAIANEPEASGKEEIDSEK